ncbi:MAG: hypothetical protein MHMPM18_000236 [Marteilia pararefringens]
MSDNPNATDIVVDNNGNNSNDDPALTDENCVQCFALACLGLLVISFVVKKCYEKYRRNSN